jgi:hypothetical protein
MAILPAVVGRTRNGIKTLCGQDATWVVLQSYYHGCGLYWEPAKIKVYQLRQT